VTMTLGQAEMARRRSLDALGVLDTPSEERFDRITRLARLTFDVMLSTVTLIDRDRAWFKSCAGGDYVEAPREVTFCAQTVLADEPVVVVDATMDERFATLPAVAGEPGIRFYAGFPVHDAYGTAIGTLCLYDIRPRTLDDTGVAIMAELTSWVESELIASDETERARSVQQALLPRHAPDIPGYEAAAFCQAATSVAGDFFDHQRHGDGERVHVADVMGKGSGAAMIMASVRAVLRSENRALAAGRFGPDGTLGQVLTEVNSLLLEDMTSSGSFVTGFFGWADPVTGTIRYVDAGHGLSVVARADGTTEHLRTTDLPLGITDAWRWTEQSITLHPGDDLVCFSDGLLDLMGGTLDTIPAISRLVQDADGPREVISAIRSIAASGPLPDDITVIAIRRRAELA
jgi:sigma-B regulation protein RsbU (phosphoserine phosphatase)